MRRYYESRLGFSLEHIRELHPFYNGLSYAQVERELFRDLTGRDPTWKDYLYWWWRGREHRRLDRLHADKQASSHGRY